MKNILYVCEYFLDEYNYFNSSTLIFFYIQIDIWYLFVKWYKHIKH